MQFTYIYSSNFGFENKLNFYIRSKYINNFKLWKIYILLIKNVRDNFENIFDTNIDRPRLC